MSYSDRVIVLIDMDCFYCQVEEKLDETLHGKPVAVVQYNTWKGGGIIAVNYTARDKGVTRHMRGDEAKMKCPEIELVRVPQVRGKADLTKYREAGKSVVKVLQSFTELLERASVDEAYLDITDSVIKKLEEFKHTRLNLEQVANTHVVGIESKDFFENIYSEFDQESNFKLAVGSVIVEEIRAAVYSQTGFRCSAGIAHNKILAKLACGLHKPNKQTILPENSISELYERLPLKKIRSLGGKFGSALSEELGIVNMAELAQFTEKQLINKYDEKTAKFLYNIARGIDLEPVTTRLVSKSIGTCKKFPGKSALTTSDQVQHWLSEFSQEIMERLEQDIEENNRKAKQMVVTYSNQISFNKNQSGSKSLPLNSYDSGRIMKDAFETVKKQCMKTDGSFALAYLGLSVGKFEDCKNTKSITEFFKQMNEKDNQVDDTHGSFSDSTVDLNEPDDGVFWEPNLKRSVDTEDDDSISEELFQETNQQSQKGFFSKYFQEKQETRRDFNTSRNLPDSDEETSGESSQLPDTMETCTECNTKVPPQEMTSHMDHHLALNIMKSEKTQKSPIKITSPKKTTKSKVKRRKIDKSQNTLMGYFKNNADIPSTSANTKLCTECNKQIEVDNFTSHLDYHYAKKLHMEMNPVKETVKKKEKTDIKKYFKSAQIL